VTKEGAENIGEKKTPACQHQEVGGGGTGGAEKQGKIGKIKMTGLGINP